MQNDSKSSMLLNAFLIVSMVMVLVVGIAGTLALMYTTLNGDRYADEGPPLVITAPIVLPSESPTAVTPSPSGEPPHTVTKARSVFNNFASAGCEVGYIMQEVKPKEQTMGCSEMVIFFHSNQSFIDGYEAFGDDEHLMSEYAFRLGCSGAHYFNQGQMPTDEIYEDCISQFNSQSTHDSST